VRVDVLLGEGPVAPADVAGRVVVVIDVLRASTTAAIALANGARALVPCESVEEAAERAKAMDQDAVRLGGERRMMRIPGFDFGNSPLEYSAARVAGLTVVFTTTNGTRALVSTHAARSCYFAGFVNAHATITAVQRASNGELDVTIVCAGTEGHVALEDVACAGRLARGLLAGWPDANIGDGARIAMLCARPYQDDITQLARDATHAASLVAAGFADDVACCLALDSVPVPVEYGDGRLRVACAARD
jgi:2-phosphosulfolactate phosphatase